MVKLICFVKRRPGLSVEEFRRHWREVHGPLIAGTPALARHILRYEQHPRADPDYERGDGGYDGVAVQWFESIDEFWAFVSEPEYATVLHPDERELLDLDHLAFILTEEPNVVIDRL